MYQIINAKFVLDNKSSLVDDRITELEKNIFSLGKAQQKAEEIHREEISKMQAVMSSMSKGILALLKQDANIISAIIISNVEEENKNILETSRNEENNGVEIRGGTKRNGTIKKGTM